MAKINTYLGFNASTTAIRADTVRVAGWASGEFSGGRLSFELSADAERWLRPPGATLEGLGVVTLFVPDGYRVRATLEGADDPAVLARITSHDEDWKITG